MTLDWKNRLEKIDMRKIERNIIREIVRKDMSESKRSEKSND